MVDLDTGKLIGLVKDKKSQAIEKFLSSWGNEILAQIQEVSRDLCKMYKNIVEKLCPNAVITVDRFHVTKLLHGELNQGRIEQKKTAESLEVKARVKLFSSLKGVINNERGFGSFNQTKPSSFISGSNKY